MVRLIMSAEIKIITQIIKPTKKNDLKKYRKRFYDESFVKIFLDFDFYFVGIHQNLV